MTSAVIGHKKILDYFARVLESGNLSHAYCFVGPAMVGKRTLALELSARLLKTTVDRLKVQPDFVEVSQIKNKKTGKTNKDIVIRQFRDDNAGFFSTSAFLGGYKIMLVSPAEKINLNAANNLLKHLEEPRRKSLVFLLTTDERQLPQTILSRCQMIYFSPVSAELIKSDLVASGFDEAKAEEMARLSRGLPGLARRFAQATEAYADYQKEVLRFNALIGQPFYDKISQVEELFGEKKDSDHILQRLLWVEKLSMWRMVVRDFLLQSYERDNFRLHHLQSGSQLPTSILIEVDRRIKQAQRDLERNIHPRLLIENILLSIP